MSVDVLRAEFWRDNAPVTPASSVGYSDSVVTCLLRQAVVIGAC